MAYSDSALTDLGMPLYAAWDLPPIICITPYGETEQDHKTAAKEKT